MGKITCEAIHFVKPSTPQKNSQVMSKRFPAFSHWIAVWSLTPAEHDVGRYATLKLNEISRPGSTLSVRMCRAAESPQPTREHGNACACKHSPTSPVLIDV